MNITLAMASATLHGFIFEIRSVQAQIGDQASVALSDGALQLQIHAALKRSGVRPEEARDCSQ